MGGGGCLVGRRAGGGISSEGREARLGCGGGMREERGHEVGGCGVGVLEGV
jgi:hypothetical protein